MFSFQARLAEPTFVNDLPSTDKSNPVSDKLKISIVTISFNQSKYLERAILSVIEQNYQALQYIVVDAGSTDGSREIIEKYRSRIHEVIFEADRGAADGLNKGFSLAKGEILGFLNSDDEFLPDALNKVARAFEINPDMAAISGTGYFVDADNRRLSAIVPNRMSTFRYLYGSTTLFQQGTFFRKDWFEKVGGFNILNRTCWDGELFFDIAAAGGKFGLLVEDLALFRIHDQSITGSGTLNATYLKDSDRIFHSFKGHSRNILDRGITRFMRMAKWFLEPGWAIRRINARARPGFKKY